MLFPTQILCQQYPLSSGVLLAPCVSSLKLLFGHAYGFHGIGVYTIFIPHCHGNGLVISGVYSHYMHDYLMGSRIYGRFTDVRTKG